jgi:hypothetical protein
VEETLTIAWIVGHYWLSYRESSGESVTAEVLQQGVDLIIRLFKPYLDQ